MEFKIECPWCNQDYSVDESIIGQKVRCAVCKNEFIASRLKDDTPVPLELETTPVIEEKQSSTQRLYSQTYNQNRYGVQPGTVHVHQNAYMRQPQQSFFQPLAESDKSRDTFALLGFFLGFLGIHSFYLGKTKNGIATIFANFLCSSPVVIFFVGVELLTTTTDCQNLPLKDKDSPLALILGILLMIGGILLFIISLPFYFARLIH